MDELTQEQHGAVLAARRALAQAIEKKYPPRLSRSLIAVAIAGQFADMVAASIGAADLVEIINDELAGAGLELRQLPRN